MGKISGTATRTISITSGKGGVGKTTLVANLAVHLAEKGNKVLILDGDMGMANIDIFFGVRPSYSIMDLLNEQVSMEEVIVDVGSNISLVPGGSGIRELNNLSPFQRRSLLDAIGSMTRKFDYLLVDTAPGISDNVLYLNASSQVASVIITPDPASLADSYALIKVLNRTHRSDRFSIICNQVRDEKEGLGLFHRFSEIVSRFLYIGIDYWGSIPMDLQLRRATHLQKLIVKHDPQCDSSLAIRNIAGAMESSVNRTGRTGGLQVFWESYVGVA